MDDVNSLDMERAAKRPRIPTLADSISQTVTQLTHSPSSFASPYFLDQNSTNASPVTPPLPMPILASTPNISTPSQSTSDYTHDAVTPQQIVLSNGKSVSINEEDMSSHTIIVGGRTFVVSWASLNSDGPNNFTVNWKDCPSQVIRLDRDPDNFEIILQHLRGYCIYPKDAIQNANLIADAEFYGFKRLKAILRQMIFINVSGTMFRLGLSLIEKDAPNFFSLSLNHHFEGHSAETIGEASVIYVDRDPAQFAEIIRYLQGYTLTIRDENHRLNLLKDAHFYAFRGLRDRLLSSRTVQTGIRPEVLLWLTDVRIINLIKPDKKQSLDETIVLTNDATGACLLLDDPAYQVNYKRDSQPHTLLVQFSSIKLKINYYRDSKPTCTFEPLDQDLKKLKDIARAVDATDVNSAICIEGAAAIEIDGIQLEKAELDNLGDIVYKKITPSCEILRRLASLMKMEQGVYKLDLILMKCMMSIYVFQGKLIGCLVRFEGVSGRRQVNWMREFLPPIG